ncbi:MAG: MerR family transcriptional regulator [Bacteroidia bacterium]|nr:MerR family transcriptional regulator [Bacteroidia bacterium]
MEEDKKLFYRMGEVAEMLALKPSVLRFWETEFDMLKPRKNGKGDRLYAEEDIQQLKVIRHLVKEKGYTLQGANELIKKGGALPEKEMGVVEQLKKVRAFLVELKEQL